MPDFPLCYKELKRKGMTKILLWQEYQQKAGENAYGYSQFCNLYGEWLKLQKRSMRQQHVAGENLFLDFCGPTVPVINPDRYQRGSTIIISQLSVSEWYKLVGNPTVADALMDRLLHNGHRVELRGESMRKPVRRVKN